MNNSATLWHPVTENLDIPQPRTIMVPYNHHESLCRMMDGTGPLEFVEDIKKAANEIGYPVFIRTCEASAKHDGPGSYRADSEDHVMAVVCATLEDSEIKLGMQDNNLSAFMVREFLDLEAGFAAFGGWNGFTGERGPQHPIATEFRFFANPDGVACSHAYWPAEAIDRPDNDDWKQILETQCQISKTDQALLEVLAVLAAGAIPGGHYWSVDFARGTDGVWYMIDMARAECSFHHPECDREHPWTMAY